MKKVAINTLSGYYNLGNRLQNYALQESLKKLGCKVETLFKPFENWNTYKPLEEFSKKYLNERYVDVFDQHEVEQLGQQYDYFIVGSDQVWNCLWKAVRQSLDFNFLTFAPSEKRISYAAGISIHEIPERCKCKFVNGINNMAAISVREQEGADLIKNLCGRTAEVHIDPTMLLTADEYRKIAKPHPQKPSGKYMIVYDENLEETATQFAEKRNWKVVNVLKMLFNGEIGVEEFLDLIDDAECVVSASFHFSVFSIIFHKPFVVEIDNSVMDSSSRLMTLTKTFKLENQIYQGPSSLEDMFSADFSQVDDILEKERKRSFRYLRDALHLHESEKAEIVPTKDMCCGCGACKNACPVNCITMEADEEGFLYPHIDEAVCVHCDLCKNICPILNVSEKRKQITAFAAINTDEKIRAKSSSGGAFTALAKQVIENGGVVFGAAFDEKCKVVHKSAETMEEVAAFRGSKYVQSDIGDCYREAKDYLESGRMVLFTGTGCQIEALKAVLGKEYPNLLTADLICHGVSSPLAWKKYVDYREYTAHANITAMTFRNKEKGWIASEKFEFSDFTTYESQWDGGIFITDFMTNRNLRSSCYHCKFKTLYRCSDFTLADFWGIQYLVPDMFDNRGTSLLLVHSQTGLQFLLEHQDNLKLKEVPVAKALRGNPNMTTSEPESSERAAYFKRLKEEKWYV